MTKPKFFCYRKVGSKDIWSFWPESWFNRFRNLNLSLPHEFAFEPITEDFVLRQLKQLKTNKAIGLDNISARLLKDSASVISASLTRLFNLSLETRSFPSLWKFGKVAALFKKGDRCDANN